MISKLCSTPEGLWVKGETEGERVTFQLLPRITGSEYFDAEDTLEVI